MFEKEDISMNRIITYPNSILNIPTNEVEYIDKKLHHDIQIMTDVLKTFGKFAAGLAANQIGKSCRVFVYHDEVSKRIRPIINPYIVHGEGGHVDFEGCLSFPDTWALVRRYTDISVRFVDFYEMTEVVRDFTAFEARLFQHEIEHLDGDVFIDNLSEEERNEFMARYARNNRGSKNTRR